MPRMRLRAGLLAVLALVLPLVFAQTSAASGDLDQTLAGDPDCVSANFNVAVGVGPGQTMSQFQEVAPSGPALSGVDLCLNISNPAVTPRVNIRAGTPSAPGRLLAVGAVAAPPTGTGMQWVHFDVPPLTIAAGQKVLIELMTVSGFGWMFTCPPSLPVCTPNPDAYAAGGNSFSSASGDFGFRTYAVAEGSAGLTFRNWAPMVSRQTVEDSPDPGKPPTGSFANLAAQDLGDSVSLAVDYTYDGPLPTWVLLGVVDPNNGSTIYSLSTLIEARTARFSWTISCADILAQFQYSSQKDAPVVYANFVLRFSYGGPTLAVPLTKACTR